MRQIRDANIPIPPSGYWTKINVGKKVEKTPFIGEADRVVSLYKVAPTTRQKATHKPKQLPINNIESHNKSEPKAESNIDKSTLTYNDLGAAETISKYGAAYNVYHQQKRRSAR